MVVPAGRLAENCELCSRSAPLLALVQSGTALSALSLAPEVRARLRPDNPDCKREKPVERLLSARFVLAERMWFAQTRAVPICSGLIPFNGFRDGVRRKASERDQPAKTRASVPGRSGPERRYPKKGQRRLLYCNGTGCWSLAICASH